MITAPALSDAIASDAHDLQDAYPKGATLHDLAGWYGQPIARIEEALAELRESGAALSFIRQEAEKDPAAVAMGQKGGRARAEKVDAGRRAEIARGAAEKRWSEQARNREERLAMGRASRTSAKRGTYAPKDSEEPTPDEVRQRLIGMIPQLVDEYPAGIVFEQLIFELRVSTHRGRYVTAQAKREGWLETANERNERTKAGARCHLYLFDGMVRGAPALTERQEDVFAWLARNQKDGEVTARMNQICRDLKITDGTVFGHLYAIEKKGYIERLTGYNERVNGVRVSPRFKVLQAPEPEVVRLAKPLEKLPDAEPDDEYIKTLKDRRAKLESEIEKIDELIQFHHESARS